MFYENVKKNFWSLGGAIFHIFVGFLAVKNRPISPLGLKFGRWKLEVFLRREQKMGWCTGVQEKLWSKNWGVVRYFFEKNEKFLELYEITFNSLGIAWITWNLLGITWNHLESLGITWNLLGIAWTLLKFTWNHLESLGITWNRLESLLIHLESLGIAWNHLESTWNHLESLGNWLESLGITLKSSDSK